MKDNDQLEEKEIQFRDVIRGIEPPEELRAAILTRVRHIKKRRSNTAALASFAAAAALGTFMFLAPRPSLAITKPSQVLGATKAATTIVFTDVNRFYKEDGSLKSEQFSRYAVRMEPAAAWINQEWRGEAAGSKGPNRLSIIEEKSGTKGDPNDPLQINYVYKYLPVAADCLPLPKGFFTTIMKCGQYGSIDNPNPKEVGWQSSRSTRNGKDVILLTRTEPGQDNETSTETFIADSQTSRLVEYLAERKSRDGKQVYKGGITDIEYDLPLEVLLTRLTFEHK